MPVKPSENEEKYFKELELRQHLEKLSSEQANMAQAEKKRLKDLHWMHCPKCGQKLAAEKYGKVEVDVCPGCKGVWLDANELDTIIQSASQGRIFHSFLKVLGTR